MTLLKRQAYFEGKFNTLKSEQLAFAMLKNQWLCYKVAGDRRLLEESYDLSVAMSEANGSNIELYFMSIFLSIELGDIDKAFEFLKAFKSFRGYYKNNDKKSYSVYIFLLALANSRAGKKRAALKNYKILLEIGEEESKANGNKTTKLTVFNSLFLGMLNNELDDFDNAMKFLSHSYGNGCRNVFIFPSILDLFGNSPKTIDEFDAKMFFGMIRWALNKNIDISGLVANFKNIMSKFSKEYKELLQEVHRQYPTVEILAKICIDLMSDMDYSENAFYFYKEAEMQQLELPNIYTYLIRTANLVGNENISRYALSKFLETETLDRELLAFAYHIVINRPENIDLLQRYNREIIEFASESLRRSETGRYYNSVYTQLIKNGTSDSRLMDYAEKIIYEDLFKYRMHVEDDRVKHIWIVEKQLKNMCEYVLIGKTRIVNVADIDFTCIFLGEDKRDVLDASYKVVKLVENTDIALYERFFNKGFVSTQLLITLSNNYISKKELSQNDLKVLKTTASNTEISFWYRNFINATIGNYYTQKTDYNSAYKYYREVDENNLDDKYIEQMVMSYINGEDFASAVKLIMKKAECVSDRALFFALKKIITVKKYDKDIADVAYELILKSWYDKNLIEIVLKHYNGSQGEWQSLNKALLAMSLEDKNLDEIILRNAMWMHVFDKDSQSVFCRMYEMDKENSLIKDYSIFCSYQLLVNKLKPEYETIETLEKIFVSSKDHFLGYGLCHAYIGHKVITIKSDEIIKTSIKNAEADKTIFPIFKHLKDKNDISSYIESNQPFTYRGVPGRTIKLYYKSEDDKDFRSKKMQHIRFGIYYAHVAHFYGEKLIYYFSEEMDSGSIETKPETIENNNMFLSRENNNLFYVINNALIYEHMFKYEEVETIIENELKEKPRIKGWIL